MGEEYYSYSLSGKIRKYMHGILLLLLAGFIITAVENAVASIPDTVIEIPSPSMGATTSSVVFYGHENIKDSVIILSNPDLIEDLWGYYYTIYHTMLLYPPPAYKYVIMLQYKSNIRYIEIWKCSYPWRFLAIYSNSFLIINNYIVIEWGACIHEIYIFTHGSPYNGTIYIFVVKANTDIYSINPSVLSNYNVVSLPIQRSNPLIVLPADSDENFVHELNSKYFCNVYYPILPKPPQGYKYVIVFPEGGKVPAVEIHTCRSPRERQIVNFPIYQGLGYIVFNECIRIVVVFSETANYPASPIFIFLVEADKQVPFPVNVDELYSQLTTSSNIVASSTGISVKLVLRLISWIATIVLVLTALHKFDIYI